MATDSFGKRIRTLMGGLALRYIGVVIPLMESISTAFIFMTYFNSALAKLVFGTLMFVLMLHVYRTNTIRHCNNIMKRKEQVKVYLQKYIELIKSNMKSMKFNYLNVVYTSLLLFILASTFSFSVFAYQAYTYAVVIFLKHLGLTSVSAYMPLFTYLVIYPAAIFSMFAHWSDILSTYRRAESLRVESLRVEHSGVGQERQPQENRVLVFFTYAFFMAMNLKFAMYNFKSALSKHLHYLAMYPSDYFRYTEIYGFFVSFMMKVNEVLKGFNFALFLRNKEIINFRDRSYISISKFWSLVYENKFFIFSAASASVWKGYNVAKTSSSFSSFIPSALPFFWNNIADNLKGNNSDGSEPRSRLNSLG